jgi:hypothetical protein
MFRTIGCVLLLASLCDASDAFTPPVIGYVAGQPANEVRAIIGTPGAARVTLPLPLPSGITRVAVAPGRTFGIASMQDVESLVLLHSLDTEPAATLIVGAMKSFDRAVFSPSGKAAVVYGAECGCVQTISGLPGEPEVRTVGALDREAIALAVSDDASIVVRALIGELAVFRGDAVQTWPVTAPSLALSADANTLAVLDSEKKAVSLVRDPAGAAEWSLVSAEGEPVAVGFTGSASLVIGDAVAGIRIIDNSSGQTIAVECACKPTSIERTAVENAFRLTGLDAGAVWLLQTGESEARMIFVPLQRLEAQEPSQ